MGNQKMITAEMLYKFLCVSRLFQIETPDREIHKIEDENLSKFILKAHYSDTLLNGLYLFAIGEINEEIMETIVDISENGQDIAQQLNDFENLLGKAERGESKTDIKTALYMILKYTYYKCALPSFEEFYSVYKSGKNDIEVIDGFIHLKDELFSFAKDCGFKFVNVHNNVVSEISGEVSNHWDDGEKIASFEPYQILAVSSVFRKAFSKDFVEYIGKDSPDIISSEKYNEFLIEHRLKFTVSSKKRRRRVCSSKINHFDYDIIRDNVITAAEYDKIDDFSIDAAVAANLSEDELCRIVLKDISKNSIISEDTIYKVENYGKYYLYRYKFDKYETVDKDEYARDLFDFKHIWSVILKAVGDQKVIGRGNEIVIPQEYMNQIPDEQKPYAAEMLKEQIELRKNKNPFIRGKESIRERIEKYKAEHDEKGRLTTDAPE